MNKIFHFGEKLDKYKVRVLKEREARAVAEEVAGEGEFKVGDAERFWDYETSTGDYLSLGLDEKTKERMDLTGKIVDNEDVSIV